MHKDKQDQTNACSIECFSWLNSNWPNQPKSSRCYKPDSLKPSIQQPALSLSLQSGATPWNSNGNMSCHGSCVPGVPVSYKVPSRDPEGSTSVTEEFHVPTGGLCITPSKNVQCWPAGPESPVLMIERIECPPFRSHSSSHHGVSRLSWVRNLASNVF